MRISSLLCNMHSSFSEWKKRRDTRGAGDKPSSQAGPNTSRVKTFPERGPESLSGVQSFGQMVRTSQERKGRPASEVGSVRSYRSVMTVEEQVTEVERQVKEMKEELEEMKAKTEETNTLLKEFLLTQSRKGEAKKP
jgi:hypothetical protein